MNKWSLRYEISLPSSKEELYCIDLLWQKRKWLHAELFDRLVTKSSLCEWRKDMHLMQAINAPTTTFIRQRRSEEFYSSWDNGHLKMKPTYTISSEDMKDNFCAKTFIILYVKSILCILEKLEKTLKTPWTYWEKRPSANCKSIFKMIIDLVIMQRQPTNLFWFV